MIELACVDPARVHEIWPTVRPMIAEAMQRGGLGNMADVERSVLGWHSLVWLALADDGILAAAVTCLVLTEEEKVCLIQALAGRDLERFLPLLERLEKFARDEGCDRIRVAGRKGWARVLKNFDFRQDYIVLDKVL